MPEAATVHLTAKQIRTIEEKWGKCDRIELVPTEKGFKIFYIKRTNK